MIEKNRADEIIDKVKNGMSKATTAAATWLAQASVDYKTAEAAHKIQAQGALYNLQRQATREMPIIPLNSRQEEALLFPEYRGKGFWIQLDPDQTDYVFQQSLEQRCLDKDSRVELATVVAPKVGIPALLELVTLAHETVGRELIVPYINKGVLQEFHIKYEDTVNNPLYIGTNRGIKLNYNLHSPDKCRAFSGEYQKSRKNVDSLRKKLRGVGVEIDHVAAEGIFLEVYLKWVGA